MSWSKLGDLDPLSFLLSDKTVTPLNKCNLAQDFVDVVIYRGMGSVGNFLCSSVCACIRMGQVKWNGAKSLDII